MSKREFLEEIDGVLSVYDEVIEQKNVTKPKIVENVMAHTNLVPRLFLRGRKDPGRSWSRESPDFGDKL